MLLFHYFLTKRKTRLGRKAVCLILTTETERWTDREKEINKERRMRAREIERERERE